MEIITSSFLVGIGIGLLTVCLVAFLFSSFKVEEGHLAVLTRFGAVLTEGEQPLKSKNEIDFVESRIVKTYRPGFHLKKPWDKVHRFSIMERVIDLTGEDGGQHTLAADGTLLRIDAKIRFVPLSNNYYSYLFEFKNPVAHLREMFTCLLRNEIANFSSGSTEKFDFIGSYSQIRRDRSMLNQQMDLFYRDNIGSKYGVQFKHTDLIDILPPPELDNALNAIQNAQTESDTIYARAEANSRQRMAAAEQGLEIAKIKAEATAIEILTLAETIKKLMAEGQWQQYLQHRKIEILGDSRLTFVQKGDF